MPEIEAETTERDLIVEVEALLTKVAPDGKIRDGASAYLFDMRGPDLLRRLVDEVKQSRQLVEIQSRESDGDLTTIQKALAENAALRAQLAQAHSDNERLALVVQNIEEREAAVCPEDVGFDEYIRTLQRKLETRPQAGYPWTGNEP